MVNEIAIAEAIADLDAQDVPNYLATARKYNVDRCTLQRRFKGTHASKIETHLEISGNLSPTQEQVLVERINILSARGMPPTPQFVRNLVQEMVGKEVGDHWVSRFVKRHDGELLSIYLESIDYARRVADNGKHFEHYFRTLEEKMRKYRIKPSNTWNMDEKGFLIGICTMMRRIVAAAQLKT